LSEACWRLRGQMQYAPQRKELPAPSRFIQSSPLPAPAPFYCADAGCDTSVVSREHVMEHDGASIETISISTNSHEIRTLNAASTAYLAMRCRGPVTPMNGPWALVSHSTSHVAPPPFPAAGGAVYGSGTGPKSGGGTRCFVAASYAEAMRRSVGSEKGLPKNMIPSGSFAGTGPTRRVPSGAAGSRTLSNT
jgi:hypothetical protein